MCLWFLIIIDASSCKNILGELFGVFETPARTWLNAIEVRCDVHSVSVWCWGYSWFKTESQVRVHRHNQVKWSADLFFKPAVPTFRYRMTFEASNVINHVILSFRYKHRFSVLYNSALKTASEPRVNRPITNFQRWKVTYYKYFLYSNWVHFNFFFYFLEYN